MCGRNLCYSNSVLFSRKTMLLAFIIGFLSLFGMCHGVTTVEDKLKKDTELSEFYSLLAQNDVATMFLKNRKVTIFAPTNLAFQRFNGTMNDNFVLYHVANVAQSLDELGMSVTTLSDGSPPLWITRNPKTGPGDREDVFINNAMVIPGRSFKASNEMGKIQVLHVIDEVLVPITAINNDTSIDNPDAFKFLNNSDIIQLEHHRIRSFRQRVKQNNKENVFKTSGRHTFFIPVDEGFKPPPRSMKIDQKVIDAHVIPGQVLFVRPTPKNEEFETLANTDNVRVTVTFTTQPEGKDSRLYVSSNTLVGDSNHATGVVLAEIVKANIPVSNGVVHLIQRPFMVIDITVTQFLEEKPDGPLFQLYEVIMDHKGVFMDRMTEMNQLTLFAPSNLAWKNPNLVNIRANDKRMREILNLHLVSEKLSLERITKDHITQVESAADRKNLYFNIVEGAHSTTLTVEGGGVNATVIQADIAATNGIVHIIDRVLGVPYATVYEKLASDPALNKTFFLGQSHRFNEQLNDPKKRFTYFVPRDSAWDNADLHSPSATKKLFMSDYQYHAQQILERHLIVGQSYSMADLKKLLANNESAVLPTVRDELVFKIKEIDRNYYLKWQSEDVQVSRPDVECTNGIIHVIDKVLLRESDVRVTGSAGLQQVTLSMLLAQIAALLLARAVL